MSTHSNGQLRLQTRTVYFLHAVVAISPTTINFHSFIHLVILRSLLP